MQSSNYPVDQFMKKISGRGFGVTQQATHGSRGPVRGLVLLMPRKRLEEFQPLLREFDPNAFYTIEDISATPGISP